MPSALASRLALTWATVRDSLWFIPTIAAITGVVLALVVVRIPAPDAEGAFVNAWLFGGGAEGARGVLSAIASGLITVTGVVFSVTIVAIQQASSQFTPRVLGSFMADRVNQVVLGVFIGTFTYTLLVLRTIRSPADERELYVPHVGVALALLLLLASIGALIVFINHAARSLQVSMILSREAKKTRARIDALFPESTGRPAVESEGDEARATPAGRPVVVRATSSGYVQALNAEALWKAAGDRPLTIRMELHVGAFVFPGKALASVWPAEAADDETCDGVRAAFVVGPERTLEEDAEFGIIVISDIAVRALSPGVNDPTTAMHCVDRLTELLAALASRDRPEVVRQSPDGPARLIARDTSLERAAGLAFDQIRHYGASDRGIVKRLLASLMDLADVTPAGERHVLADHARAVLRAARRGMDDEPELREVERLAAKALAVIADDGPRPHDHDASGSDPEAGEGPLPSHSTWRMSRPSAP